jgi:hypothetical protein
MLHNEQLLHLYNNRSVKFDSGKGEDEKEGHAEMNVEMRSSQKYWWKNMRG